MSGLAVVHQFAVAGLCEAGGVEDPGYRNLKLRRYWIGMPLDPAPNPA